MLNQKLQLKLSQKLSPQQIQLMKLIQLSTQEFEQRLSREIEENPALDTSKDEIEENSDFESDSTTSDDSDYDEIDVNDYLSDDDIPDYKLKANNYSEDNEKDIPFTSGESFNQYLKTQLHSFSLKGEDLIVAEFIIGSLDPFGYLRREIIDISDDLIFTLGINYSENQIQKILDKIYLLDPAGVGAKNLQQCLELQLIRKPKNQVVDLALKIIKNHFDQFSKKHFEKIKTKLNIDEDLLKKSIKEIEKLNPRPGGSHNENNKLNSSIVPDFTIKIVDGELKLELNSRNAPELFVSNEYKNMLAGYNESKTKNKNQKDAVIFIKQKLDSAKWFIDAIKQRNQTLIYTMTAILNFQKKYFLSGDESKIKPMILKDIAEKINMDISTISRVANSKYVDTPYGIKLIKSFFSEGIKNSKGEEISTIEVKKSLEEIIFNEDKKSPYTDDQLTKLLNGKGYPIARRTVAKYREMIGSPVARLRKKL
ncbi:MAG: RNA polymerase sigma-54 factor [Flavobacteriaceae bacterium]|jgi:RNA polymerase sigma-54 factor|nr:MAG: RNA polymerase sigma-54 factor [Flavobacteriaceae bacterium]|tara:strand:+ start:449 stop:1891 length:1443 start_codon:yes stop_codon:yes gene_type:complete